MNLLNGNEFAELTFIEFEQLPFCFQPDYLMGNKNISILKKGDFFAPVKIEKNKFLKTLQFQFPPVNSKGVRVKEKEELDFCEEAIKYISDKKLAHRIQQPKNYALFNVVPRKAVSSPFGTYKIDLEGKTNTQILDDMQARYRSAIRQTEKLKTKIRFGISELRIFQDLHEETMKRTQSYAENFESLKDELTMSNHNTMLATVYIDNKIQGGLYLAYSKYGAYYFHGASADTTEASGAIKYLHYQIMCLMQDKGVKQYDFVGARLTDVSGTKLEGIQNFKRRFGTELVKGYLWKLDIDKTKCRAYDNLLKLKCKLKGTKFPKDIIEQEKNKEVIL